MTAGRAAKLQRLADRAALPICVACARRCVRCPCPYAAAKVWPQWPAPQPARVLTPAQRARFNDGTWMHAGGARGGR